MAQSTANSITPEIDAEIERQYLERKSAPISEDVNNQIEEQYRLRNGDYNETSVVGAFQAGVGVVENIAQMVSGFASAIPGIAAGALAATEGSTIYGPKVDINAYPEAFAEQADKTTYEPRTAKGKRYQGVLALIVAPYD